jgi:flavin reductase (DIM6/NTAB) family NADH-FMN oxidoreductase RutF
MPVTENEFRHALSRFASGVCVVTTPGSDGRHFGITVSAFCSVSLKPPLVLVCIEKITRSHDAILKAGEFAVNILSESQADISEKFSDPVFDRKADLDLDEDLPVLKNALAYLYCSVRNVYDGGDHSIFVAEVQKVRVDEGRPLVYYRGLYHAVGNNVG